MESQEEKTKTFGTSNSSAGTRPITQWIRRRFPWLLAALALCLLGVVLTAWLPLRADPFRPAERWSADWWLEPQEQNSFARLSFVHEPLSAIALAADGRTAIAVGERGTILRSADAGADWLLVNTGSQNLRGVALAADTPIAVAVGDGGIILRSANGGESWTAVASTTHEDFRAIALAPDGRTAIVASGKGTILRTERVNDFETPGLII